MDYKPQSSHCQDGDSLKSIPANSQPNVTRRVSKDRHTGIRLLRSFRQSIQSILTLLQNLREGAPFLNSNNSPDTAHFNTPTPAVDASGESEKNQATGASRYTPPKNHTFSQPVDEGLIFQKYPLKTSTPHPEYGPRKSFTHSQDAYDRAARREYILQLRNFAYTKEYPNFHVIANFYKQMPMKDFTKMMSKAFKYLKGWGVRAYFVFEPTRTQNWVHLHLMVIYDGSLDELRGCFKYALMLAGSEYSRDFLVKVKAVGATLQDYWTLCAYILKFNGRRETNRFTPLMFVKGLGLRKIGAINWFAKPKKELWAEYLAELRLKYGNKKCFFEETNVLTSQGWKSVKDITLDDEIACLVDGSLIYQKPTALYSYPCGGDAYHISNSLIDLEVTAGHRMYVNLRNGGSGSSYSTGHQLIAADELFGRRCRYKKDANWVGTDIEGVTLPALEREQRHWKGGISKPITPAKTLTLTQFLLVLATYISDGNLVNQPKSGTYGLDVTKYKQPHRTQLLSELDNLDIKYTEHGCGEKVRIYSKQLYEYFKQFGEKAPNKRLPNWIFGLSKESLLYLFEWLMWGDGHCKNGKPICFTTTSKQLADDIQRLCLHIGMAATIKDKIIDTCLVGNDGARREYHRQAYDVRIITSKLEPEINHSHAKKQNVQKEYLFERNDPVYCIEVPGHVIYVRRNGKACWTGNSSRFGATGEVTSKNIHYRKPAKTQSIYAADEKAAYVPPDRPAEIADILWGIFRRLPGNNIVDYERFVAEWDYLGKGCGTVSEFLSRFGFEVRTIDGVEQVVGAIPDPIDDRSPEQFCSVLHCFFYVHAFCEDGGDGC
jgi:hypothetical protein